ncbi:MAG: hypothetical protein COB65_09870 [Thalassobium sp.]|nr:MAG: hypothetical protein COB65_09870 [Thalassobium sp.]
MTRPAFFRRGAPATADHPIGGMILRLLPALLLAPRAATAQTAAPCDWQASAQALVEPWEDNSATFANAAPLEITFNQATGSVTVTSQLGME